MEMTTGTDITCPKCRREVEITTQGLFGGILKQMFIGAVIERAKTEGAIITCSSCGHKFPTRSK